MISWREPTAALLAATALLATAADQPPPLTLGLSLVDAARRPPERLLADTNGLPYFLVSPPRLDFVLARDAARIETMARFFDVILVDLEEAALSERMSTAYVAWNRLHERDPMATATLRANSLYLDLLSRRNTLRQYQRLGRSTLALAMGKPGRLPAELVDPPSPQPAELLGDSERGRPPSASFNGSRAARLAHARVAAALEQEWLIRSELPRVQARSALAARLLDEVRARFDAGEAADLGNAMAATVEAQREERGVEFAIALGSERLKALAAIGESDRTRP